MWCYSIAWQASQAAASLACRIQKFSLSTCGVSPVHGECSLGMLARPQAPGPLLSGLTGSAAAALGGALTLGAHVPSTRLSAASAGLRQVFHWRIDWVNRHCDCLCSTQICRPGGQGSRARARVVAGQQQQL